MDRRRFLAGTAAAPMLHAAAAEGPYRAGAREFLDTLIDKGTDRYGSKHAPVFCLSLDPETHTPPKAPERLMNVNVSLVTRPAKKSEWRLLMNVTGS